MPRASEIQTLVPIVDISINNRSLPSLALASLNAFTVTEDLESPSMFTLELDNWDVMKGQVAWSDDELFEIGTRVEIKTAYKPPLTSLILGEITGLEPEFPEDAPLSLVVRGYDLRHRLLRGTKTRSFTQMKDSDILSKIAQEVGLQVKAEDTSVLLEYVLQHNQTDLAFLQGRAERLGYEMTINQKTLSFRPFQYAASSSLTLTYGKNLLSFSPRLSTLGQVGQMEFRSFSHIMEMSNPDKTQEEVLVSRSESSSTAMGDVLGSQTAVRAFGGSTQTIADYPVFSRAEADQIAKGQLQNMALSYITAEGRCIGNPELRAGIVIDIAGVGDRFSGKYYVTATTHTASPQGYFTDFTARRNAA